MADRSLGDEPDLAAGPWTQFRCTVAGCPMPDARPTDTSVGQGQDPSECRPSWIWGGGGQKRGPRLSCAALGVLSCWFQRDFGRRAREERGRLTLFLVPGWLAWHHVGWREQPLPLAPPLAALAELSPVGRVEQQQQQQRLHILGIGCSCLSLSSSPHHLILSYPRPQPYPLHLDSSLPVARSLVHRRRWLARP